MFSTPDPPPIQPVNTAGQNANDAAAAAKAADDERRRLEKERGQAANILGGDKLVPNTGGKKTLLSGLA